LFPSLKANAMIGCIVAPLPRLLGAEAYYQYSNCMGKLIIYHEGELWKRDYYLVTYTGHMFLCRKTFFVVVS